MTAKRIIRAPHGTTLSAKSWLTEAPLRMLMNNLDPEVAERPEELVVYGGIGKAARNWACLDQIVARPRALEADEQRQARAGNAAGAVAGCMRGWGGGRGRGVGGGGLGAGNEPVRRALAWRLTGPGGRVPGSLKLTEPIMRSTGASETNETD